MSLDAELAAALRRDYREADLTPQDRAMLDFTAKLTKEAYKTTPDDLEQLRIVGFDDRAILQITMLAAWFNYINRVADVLGVGR
ncbi:MAG TPA: peroxidase [Planctomycetales bacterium]|nr:peroxidase [Planctomycetales bacterium]